MTQQTRIFHNICIFLFLAATPSIAQQTQPSTIVTVDEPPSSYKTVGQAEVSYFAGSDTTEVRTEWPAYKGPVLNASMWFEIRTKGKTITRPEFVKVSLGCSGPPEVLQKLTGFSLQADNSDISLEQSVAGGLQYEPSTKRHLRALHASISFDDFGKLVKSKTVSVHVGDVLFELNPHSRNALRDMLKAVQN